MFTARASTDHGVRWAIVKTLAHLVVHNKIMVQSLASHACIRESCARRSSGPNSERIYVHSSVGYPSFSTSVIASNVHVQQGSLIP